MLGLSVDSTDCLRAWAESLGGITYPLLSDFWPHGEIARCYGVLRAEGYAERAIFVIDKQGVIRYVDVHDIDSQPDNDVLFRILETIEPRRAPAPPPPALSASPAVAAPQASAPQASAPQASAPQAVPAADAEVVLYCTPWCPDCKRARVWFAERGVKFAEIDITKDREAARRVKTWARGYETTPTFDVKGAIVVEFNRPRLAELLGVPLEKPATPVQ